MRSPSRPRSRWWGAAPLVLLSAALVGCGHPATQEECDQLLAKSAEIELRGQNVSDPRMIAERTAAARATAKGVEFSGRCLGKRITAGALECVRKATTAEQFDACL
ncbi:MAG: hypothetical protein ABI134_20460 [Byssovorax sp.]